MKRKLDLPIGGHSYNHFCCLCWLRIQSVTKSEAEWNILFLALALTYHDCFKRAKKKPAIYIYIHVVYIFQKALA